MFLWTPKQHVLIWSFCRGLTCLRVSVAQSQAISFELSTTQTAAAWPSCSCISSEGSRRTPARSKSSVFVGSYTLATCLDKGCMHTRSGGGACVRVFLHNVPTGLPQSGFWRIFVDGHLPNYKITDAQLCLRNKNLHYFCECLRTCEICEISGQLPTQLYKEFPRIHTVPDSKAMLRTICQASSGACLEHPRLNPVGRESLTSSSPSCEAKSEQLCTYWNILKRFIAFDAKAPPSGSPKPVHWTPPEQGFKAFPDPRMSHLSSNHASTEPVAPRAVWIRFARGLSAGIVMLQPLHGCRCWHGFQVSKQPASHPHQGCVAAPMREFQPNMDTKPLTSHVSQQQTSTISTLPKPARLGRSHFPVVSSNVRIDKCFRCDAFVLVLISSPLTHESALAVFKCF